MTLRERLGFLGLDGFTTLVLSNLVIVLSAGLTLIAKTATVYRTARDAPTRPGDARTRAGDGTALAVVVLGMRLQDDRITPDYRARLARARDLHATRIAHPIFLLGGRTGSNRHSEAAKGREWLLARGVPEHALRLEDLSRHTLENLRRARSMYPELSRTPFVLVTSRYHLARSRVLAEGLGLTPTLCAAEDDMRLDAGLVLRLLGEAYFLHWYAVGRRWSQLTRSRRSLQRIT
jgi:uncharacterized SAM-binding protein YcdF (DUF218 family)